MRLSDGIHPTNSSNLQSNPRYLYTSIIGNVSIGVDFNVVKNFNINIGFGLGTRVLNPMYSYIGLRKDTLLGFSAELGLTYAFSVKKTPK